MELYNSHLDNTMIAAIVVVPVVPVMVRVTEVYAHKQDTNITISVKRLVYLYIY